MRFLAWTLLAALSVAGLGVAWHLTRDSRLDTAWEVDAAEAVIPEVRAEQEVEASFHFRNVSSRSLRIVGAQFC